MIDKLIVDNENIELTEKDTLPYNYNFTTAQTHTVKYALSGDNIDRIEAEAFKGCSYMTKVKFPKEIKKIMRRAFEDCVRLDNVVIPSTIEYVGANVFNGCTGMKALHFEGTVPPATWDSEIPAQCTVFVPNDNKYELATKPLTPDTTIYYTKSEFNQFSYAPGRTLVDDEAHEYYVDKWDSIIENERSLEEKDLIPIEKLEFITETGDPMTSIYVENGTEFTLKYKITPENATNRKIYFFDENYGGLVQNNLGTAIMVDYSEEGTIVCKADDVRQGNVKFYIYAESGAFESITVSVIAKTTEAPTEGPAQA